MFRIMSNRRFGINGAPMNDVPVRRVHRGFA
jgi:hypothetical protein